MKLQVIFNIPDDYSLVRVRDEAADEKVENLDTVRIPNHVGGRSQDRNTVYLLRFMVTPNGG